MALAATVEQLFAELNRLSEGVDELCCTAAESRPDGESHVLADQVSDAAANLRGWLNELMQEAGELRAAAGNACDLHRVSRSLANCQSLCGRIVREYSDHLASCIIQADFVNLGRRKRNWGAWSRDVRTAVERCEYPIRSSQDAISACWIELAERLGTNCVTVHATNVGQQTYCR
jgi:hypothetical protein